MPGDVIYSLFKHNNTLVMEENERKEMQESHLEASSQIRQEKKNIMLKTRQEEFTKQSCMENHCMPNNYQETLPIRSEQHRARYLELVNQSEQNKLTTTAQVERPPSLLRKEEFKRRKRVFDVTHFDTVDAPRDAGAPEEPNRTGRRGSLNNDSKERPLVVCLPEESKESDINEEYELSTLKVEKLVLAPKELLQLEDEPIKSIAVEEDQKDVETEDCTCLVTCIYYTQQCCDCSIL